MFIAEFINNNNVSTLISILLFHANKEFHFNINFDSNIIDYVIIRKRLNIVKVKDIIDYI